MNCEHEFHSTLKKTKIENLIILKITNMNNFVSNGPPSAHIQIPPYS